MSKNVGDLGKFIVAKGFKTSKKITQSGHTETYLGSFLLQSKFCCSLQQYFTLICPI